MDLLEQGKDYFIKRYHRSYSGETCQKMVNFTEPAKAFRKIGEVQVSEKYTPFIYEPDSSICDGGIVVASSITVLLKIFRKNFL